MPDPYLSPTFVAGTATIANPTELLAAIEAKLLAGGWVESGVDTHVWQSPSATKHLVVTFTVDGDELEVDVADYMLREFPTVRVGTLDAAQIWTIHVNGFALYAWGQDDEHYLATGIYIHAPLPEDSHDRDAFLVAPFDDANTPLGHNTFKWYSWNEDNSLNAASPEQGRIYSISHVSHLTMADRCPDQVSMDSPVLSDGRVAGGGMQLAGMWPQAVYVPPYSDPNSPFQEALELEVNATFKVTTIPGSTLCNIAVRMPNP